MHFLIDAQLPPALCGWFEARGHAAEHVTTALGGQTPDRRIAEHAVRGGWTLMTWLSASWVGR